MKLNVCLKISTILRISIEKPYSIPIFTPLHHLVFSQLLRRVSLVRSLIERSIHCKKNWSFTKPIKKGSVDAKSFQMSSHVERNWFWNLRNLKRFFTWIHSRNLLPETFLSFVQRLKRFRGKKNKPWSSVGKIPNLRVL